MTASDLLRRIMSTCKMTWSFFPQLACDDSSEWISALELLGVIILGSDDELTSQSLEFGGSSFFLHDISCKIQCLAINDSFCCLHIYSTPIDSLS